MIKPDKDWPRGQSAPPEPPPMRIGQCGDTIDRHGVRRKADGSLRAWHFETVVNWMVGALFTVFVVVLAVLVTTR